MHNKIQKILNKRQFLKVANAQIYSTLYYAAPIWLNKMLTSNLWTKLRSAHYRVLRAAVRDYKKRKNMTDLNKDCKRATPKMWSNYIITSTVIKSIRDGFPKYLKSKLETTLYTERRW